MPVENKLTNPPRIIIVGCGGAGLNLLNRICSINYSGIETIAVDTDEKHLDIIRADKRILIGKSLTNGEGTSGDPDIGMCAAKRAIPVIEGILNSPTLCFIVGGIGGGTCSGSAPVVAQVAKKQGAIVIGIVCYPFNAENGCLNHAGKGIQSLIAVSDSVIVLDNNFLINLTSDLPLVNAFFLMDKLIIEVIQNISKSISKPSPLGINFDEIRKINVNDGLEVIVLSEDLLQNKDKKINSGYLDENIPNVDYPGVSWVLIYISAVNDSTFAFVISKIIIPMTVFFIRRFKP